jgi:glycosyltransferase involved in cell wall biosynthesis
MQKILILFPDSHLPYSPTILNLYETLKRHFSVTILNFENRQYKKIENPHITYLSIPFFKKKVFGIINRISLAYGMIVMAYIKKQLVKSYLKKYSFDQYIVTDLIGLWMVQDMPVSPIHLVSLELTFNTVYFKGRVDIRKLSSLLIQSKERLDFVAPEYSGPAFYLQNAPVFHHRLMEEKGEPLNNHFIFSGTGSAKFGIFQCLDFLKQYPSFKMTTIGNLPEAERKIILPKYKSLIEEGRLIIDAKYYSAPAMLAEVGKYQIGFCFYDFSFPEINNINYLTAPSGKMFTYFAAGVPVIGVNIPGLKPVVDFRAGLLIDDLAPESIFEAVERIINNYDSMVKGCFDAAMYFSFDARVQPFIEFLNQVEN